MSKQERKKWRLATEADEERLLELCREGRVKILVDDEPEVDTQKLLAEVSEYVSRVDSYAARKYQPMLGEVWREIVMDDAFARSLYHIKGKNKGRLNRYLLLNIIEYLMNRWSVYEADSLTELHLRLENARQRTAVYTSKKNYELLKMQRECLIRVMGKVNCG